MRNILSITWINERLKVAVCQTGTLKESWSCPDPVNNLDDLRKQLEIAIDHTRFAGTDVMVMLHNRELVYHLQETPPGNPGNLRPFLQRKVNQQSFFEEDAEWSFHQPVSLPNKQSFLLTLIPKSMMRDLHEVCSGLGLVVTGVFSPSAILARQFKCLQVPHAEVNLLATDLGDSLSLIAARPDGQVLFCRQINHCNPGDTTRALQEINRTLLFLQQKFGQSIHNLWVFGEELFQSLSQMKVSEGMSIRPSPVEDSPFYLNTTLSMVSPLDSCNLVSTLETRRRRFRRSLVLVCTIMMLSGLVAAMVTHRVVHARETKLNSWTRDWNKLEQYRDQLMFRQKDIMRLEDQLKLLGKPDDPPLTDLFLRHLTVAIPESVQLTGVSIARKAPGYHVYLEGQIRDSDIALLPVLQGLESSLTNGLIRLQIQNSTLGDWPKRTQGRPAGAQQFYVEGQWK